ncbi:retrovirus-related pol polyprotein from transposon TNT 1-94 [Tanacetum coccineum]
MNRFVATPHKKIVASESTIRKFRSRVRMLYENVSTTCKWWYTKITPLGYKWKPKSRTKNVNTSVSTNLDNASSTLGISRNLSSVGQFCDADLEVAFRNLTCFVIDLQGNDLLTEEGIHYQTLIALTPEQNDVFERRNHTLVEVARTMLSAINLLLFFWAKAIATARFTQIRSLIITRHEQTAYHIINKRKPNMNILYVCGCKCYIVRDCENLDKMKEKGDACIFMGYSTQSKGYRVYNKRTRTIAETIHVNFDEFLVPAPQCQQILEQQRREPSSSTHVQDNLPLAYTSNNHSMSELDMLISLMFDEYFKGENEVVSKSSIVSDKSNTTQSTITPVAAESPPLIIPNITDPTTPTTQVHAEEDNNIQVDDAVFDTYEFLNPFAIMVTEVSESSSRQIDPPNMHQFY